MGSPKRVILIVGVLVTVVGVSWMLTPRRADTDGTGDRQIAPANDASTDTVSATSAESRSIDADVLPEGQAAPMVPRAALENSEQGARSAAVAYLETTEAAVEMSPEEAATLARSMSTERFADTFAADTENSMIELLETVPDGVTVRVAPIEARSTPTGDDWLVSVWFVEAITVGKEAVVDDWRTATYRMVWEDDTWRIDSFESERGPTPGRGTQPGSTTPAGFEALLDGFSDEGLS